MYGLIADNGLVWADTLAACQEAAYAAPGAYTIVGEDMTVIESGVIPEPVAAILPEDRRNVNEWAAIARTVLPEVLAAERVQSHSRPMGADSTYRAEYSRTGAGLARTGLDGGDDGRLGPAEDPGHHEERYSQGFANVAEAISFWDDWIIPLESRIRL